MKLRITENQLNAIKKSLNEGVENTYSREVKLTYYYHGVTVNGGEINDIIEHSVNLTFNIELEARSWGIKGISLYNIKGPSEIELEVEYFIDADNTKEILIPVALDWDSVEVDEQNGHGVITVGDEIEITLVNDQNGGIMVKSIQVPVYSV